jgi:uncharacterized protein involved in exopolysaccharide biosynthesis
VRRNRAPLLGAIAAGALIGNVSVYVRPPLTEANFKIHLTPTASENPIAQQWAPNNTDRIAFFAAAEQNFLSPTLVESTLEQLGDKHPPKDKVSATLSNLKFDSIAEATYQGTFTHADPVYAVRFLQQHVQNYLATEIQKTLRVIQSEVDFSAGRLKQNEDELRHTESELQAFKTAHGDDLPEYAKEHFSSREELLTRRAELNAQLSRAQLELAQARKRVAQEAPLQIKKAEAATPYETALVEVNRKLGEALARGLGEQHPEVIALKKQQAELRELAAKARAADPDPISKSGNAGLIELQNKVGDLEVAVKGAQAELGQVNSELSRLDRLMKEMPDVEARYAELIRSYAANQDLHKKLFENLKTKELQLDLERSKAQARYEIIAPPQSSGVALRKILLIRTAIGLAIGAVLGVLLAAFMELKRYMRGRAQRAPGTAIVPVNQDRDLRL